MEVDTRAESSPKKEGEEEPRQQFLLSISEHEMIANRLDLSFRLLDDIRNAVESP